MSFVSAFFDSEKDLPFLFYTNSSTSMLTASFYFEFGKRLSVWEKCVEKWYLHCDFLGNVPAHY